MPVVVIDGIQTAIKKIKSNIAKGFILNKDLSLDSCFVVKGNNLFAHGKTLKEAQTSLLDKILINAPIEERINSFKEEFDVDKRYLAQKFFDWHYRLTGSCLFGRQSFVKEKGIDLKKDMMSVDEFILLTKDSFGGEVIKKLRSN